MAWGTPTGRGSITAQSALGSVAMSPSANLTVGLFALVHVASDNLATANGASSDHVTLADNAAGSQNVWTKYFEYTDTNGVAADGTTISLWGCVIKTQVATTDVITCTFSGSITARLITTLSVTLATNAVGVETTSLGQSTITAPAIASMPSRSYLMVYAAASEGNDSSKTVTANYTEIFDLRTGNTGDVNISNYVQTRVATLTSEIAIAPSAWTTAVTNPVSTLTAFYELMTVSLSELGHLADTPTADIPVPPLTIQVTNEAGKLAETLTGSRDLTAAPSELLHLRDGGAATQQGIARLEGVLHVVDTVTAAMDLLAVPTELGHLADAVSAEVLTTGDLSAAVTQELGHLADTLTASRDLTATLAEALTLADAATAVLDPLEAAPSELGHLAETLSTTLDPLNASGAEALGIADAATVALELSASLAESLRVADAPAVTLDPIEADTNEALRLDDSTLLVSAGAGVDIAEAVTLADTVAASLDHLDAPIGTEALHITDAIDTGGDLVASRTDSLRVAETLTAVLDPLQAAPTEAVTPGDAVTASVSLSASLSEAVTLADSLTAARDLTSVVADALTLADSAQTALQLAASAQDVLKIADSLTPAQELSVDLIETVLIADRVLSNDMDVALTESLRVEDALTPRIPHAHPVLALTVQGRRRTDLSLTGTRTTVIEITASRLTRLTIRALTTEKDS